MRPARLAFVSSAIPRRCGIATFTADLVAAVRSIDPAMTCRIVAIDEPSILRPYGSEVRWRIRQGDPESYVAAARSVNASDADAVNVQHEFGLHGAWTEATFTRGHWAESVYEDHIHLFLRELRKPVVTTLHTVLPRPSPSIRDAVRVITGLSQEVIVMASTAVDILKADYGVSERLRLIPHGMPVIDPHGRVRLKAKLGVQDRIILSTFGLVDPRKGLQYMIQALPAIVARHPEALYIIAGQTHPELLRAQGEEYRMSLVAETRALGMQDHVAFIDQYMDQRDIIELLLATDIYVTPYLDPNQITSGTLAYALGAGKAVVSTPYLHASEALADGRGVLVDFRDPGQLARAVVGILEDPAAKRALEKSAFAYARDATWPRSGQAFLDVVRGMTATPARSARRRAPAPVARPLDLGRRLAENPILTAADVPPSRPGLEVVSVFNAAAARVGDEVVLLLRVGERPRLGVKPPPDALTLDLSGVEPRAIPLGPGFAAEDLVSVAFADSSSVPTRVVEAFLPRSLPGLDLSDPRRIRYHTPTGGFSAAADDFSDLLTQMSHLRVARSHDGVHFQVDPEPSVVPDSRFEEFGCEDPRATLIDGVWHITYVSVGAIGITTSRLSTTDFRSFERHGVMFLPDHKDVTIFPGRLGGRYAALTRPMPQSFGRILGIWIAFSDDLVHWGDHQPVALPRPGMWDALRTGASAVPFRVDEGWLEIYHGVDRNQRYAMGGLLLDAESGHAIARSPEPILVPIEPYERSGVFSDTVFSCGHVALDERGEDIRLYYGAADTCMAAADVRVRDILDQMQPC
ncbi:MAG TPA: glycosyltransferase [Candidatus Dormibacteraeota bacterium]|nr:glycosyltransferase [Candidatus Dormibacteraeota bacterium]